MTTDLDLLKEAAANLKKTIDVHRKEHGANAPIELDDIAALHHVSGIREFVRGDDEQDGSSHSDLRRFLGWNAEKNGVEYADFLDLLAEIEMLGLRQLDTAQGSLFCDAIDRLSRHFGAVEA